MRKNPPSTPWGRFRASRRGWWSFLLLAGIFAVSLCADWIAPDPGKTFGPEAIEPYLRPEKVSGGHYPVAAAEYAAAPDSDTPHSSLVTRHSSLHLLRAWGDTERFAAALEAPLPAALAPAIEARLRGEAAPAFECTAGDVSFRLAPSSPPTTQPPNHQTTKPPNHPTTQPTVRVYLRRADWRTAPPEDNAQCSMRNAQDSSTRHSSLVTRHSGSSGPPLEPAVFPFRPVPGHPFGFDNAGRDVFALVLHATRIALAFGLLLTLASLLLGVVAGAVQGYFAGWTDLAGQRFTEIWGALPFLYVVIFLGNAFGRSFGLLLVCYAIFNWIGTAAYVRAEFLRLRGRPFVEAARVQGLPSRRIMLRHVLPNALTPLVTLFPFLLVGAIGSLAALDYLGFGLPAGTPSWGELLQQAQGARGAWWLVLWPSLALFVVMLLGVFVGEGLRDAFDPKPVSSLDREPRRAPALRAGARGAQAQRQGEEATRPSPGEAFPHPAEVSSPASAASASEAAPFPSTQVLDAGIGAEAPVLAVEDLRISFDTAQGELRAVDGVSLTLRRGETLGLVGESGCGKSVTAMSVLRLVPSPPGRLVSGSIRYRGRDLATMPLAELRNIRGGAIGMVFQDPMSALSPLRRVGPQLLEAVRLHRAVSRAEGLRLAREALERCGIPDPDRCLREFPFRLSGGMQQRVMIAAALLSEPELVIADEPTTALDVTVQAQVLELLRTARGPDTALLLISHDMAVVRSVCERIAVMYAGRIVEEGPADEVFSHPRHPYTAALLAAMPSRHAPGERLPAIPGTLPSPLALPEGCRFAPRCKRAGAACRGPGSDERRVTSDERGHVWDCLDPMPADAERTPSCHATTTAATAAAAVRRPAAPPLLSLRSLSKQYPRVLALDGATLDLAPGETLAVVGESGSGKTTLARLVAGLERATAGDILFDGAPLPFDRSRAQRREIQMVFQDPYASLNPRGRIGDLVTEGAFVHGLVDRAGRAALARELLAAVGLPPEAAARHPHEFSGGQLQRVSIARALALEPRLLLCDEPVSALDVSVQAQILNLLADLKRERGPAMLFITHDLAVARSVADRVAVMAAGRIVELGPAAKIFSAPEHPVTHSLLAAEPR